MKPVTQRIVGVPDAGDCLAAAIASVMELELDDLRELHDPPDQWWPVLEKCLARRGFRPVGITNDRPGVAPTGYSVAVGPAALHRENAHAVVALDGEIVHDPHPNKTGLERIAYWIIFVPLARSVPRLSPDEIEMPL